MNNEAIEKTAADADDEPVTSKGGEGQESAHAAGAGPVANIKVGSPTDGSGIVADPDQ